jgi:hypothetical protein
MSLLAGFAGQLLGKLDPNAVCTKKYLLFCILKASHRLLCLVNLSKRRLRGTSEHPLETLYWTSSDR